MGSDVAIVGMACVMPGAPDHETFWANIVDGVDAIDEVSPSRWDADLHFDANHDPSARQPGEAPKSVSKWGGWVPDVGFDPLAWGIPPASLASIDPAQLLALRVAAEALEDAGYAGNPGNPGNQPPGLRQFDRERTSLVYATGSGGAAELSAGFLMRMLLLSHHTGGLPAELDAFLPELTEDGLPGVLTSLIAGRVANRLDLGGKNLTVDSACASVLVGLDIACSELSGGGSDMVLCGGVDLHNGVQDYVSFTAAGALSPRGRCHSFDAGADGMTLAEGAGCLVLKRLDDALASGDRVYAVVRGVAGSSDGRHLGLTAPRREGQVTAVRRAYSAAGMSPAEVGLVEAHGTGTAAGDRTELETMTQTFTEAGSAVGSVVLGTVKSNIGHIKCAAGVASLIKTAKALYHGVLPPTLHIRTPNEAWNPGSSPFVFLDQARPWLDERRVAGVSGFGFGGTNFHAVLEAEGRAVGTDSVRVTVPQESGRPAWPAELVVLRAADETALAARVQSLTERLADDLTQPRQADRWRLRDVAAAESLAGDGPAHLALVATSLDDLAQQLQGRQAGRLATAEAPGVPAEPDRIAFLYPGPEAARPAMGADLLVAFPAARPVIDAEADATLQAMFPAQAFTPEVRDQQAQRLQAAAAEATALYAGMVEQVLAGLGVTPMSQIGLAAGGEAQAVDDQQLANQILEAHAAGVQTFIDLGPGDRLAGLARQTLADQAHIVVSIDPGIDRGTGTGTNPSAGPGDGRHGVFNLLQALAVLVTAGVPVGLEYLFAGRGCRPERWLDPPKAPGWTVNGHYARKANGESLPGGLHPADQAPQLVVGTPSHPPPGWGPAQGSQPPPPDDATMQDIALVTNYLRTVQGIVATTAQVLAAHQPSNGEVERE